LTENAVILKKKSMEYKDLTFTPVFVEDPEGGYSAYIEEIPGVNMQGKTKEEAEENLRDALAMILESRNQPEGSKEGEADWWDGLSNSEIESIKQGLKDFEEGNIHSHEEALKVYGKYL
jgi:predicted RNase H-like HicB family nuclease